MVKINALKILHIAILNIQVLLSTYYPFVPNCLLPSILKEPFLDPT